MSEPKATHSKQSTRPTSRPSRANASPRYRGANQRVDTPSLPSVWQVCLWLLQNGGMATIDAMLKAFPALSDETPQALKTILREYLQQHLFTQRDEWLVCDSALALCRLEKWSLLQHGRGSHMSDNTATPASLPTGQMLWRKPISSPTSPLPALSPANDGKPIPSTARPKQRKIAIAESTTPQESSDTIPFVADSQFPFFLGDVVLGIIRSSQSQAARSKHGTRRGERQPQEVILTFEPLYLVSRSQRAITAYLLNDSPAPKAALTLARKQWLLPIDNPQQIPKPVLSRQGLIRIAVLPTEGLMHTATAHFLDEVNDDDPESIGAILEHLLPHEFSEAALQACRGLKVPPLDMLQGSHQPPREDLRDLPLITIDGEDAKDFDDAVYAMPTQQGYRLFVAIADVSFYVTPASALDQEAQDRATSVYFPRRVVPMLPPALSENLCSLRPNEDRAVLCVEMNVNKHGEIGSFRFYPALMHSQARMTYGEVEGLLFAQDQANSQRSPAVLHNLLNLKGAYQCLAKARAKRGALELDSREWKFRFAEGRVVETYQPVRLEAHRLIEECMIAANVCAARLLAEHKSPLLYRVHEAPTTEKINLLHGTIVSQGIDWEPATPINPESLSDLLRRIKVALPIEEDSARESVSMAKRDLLQMSVLRSLKQAQYSPSNVGHFGLGLTHYAHFTSPIRRYPDLLVHRQIMQVLIQQIKGEVTDAAKTVDWTMLGMHCTQCEKRADEASRAAANQLRCELTLPMVGQEVMGTITGVASFGVFVQLPVSMADGMLPARVLGDALGEYLEYLADYQVLAAPRSGMRFSVGDRISVMINAVLPSQRKIDLGYRSRRGGSQDRESKTLLANENQKKRGTASAKKLTSRH